MRRSLAETLTGLAEAMSPAPEIQEWIRVTSLTMDVPIEIAMHGQTENAELFANPPQWRWRTPFDEIPSRLRITLEEFPTL